MVTTMVNDTVYAITASETPELNLEHQSSGVTNLDF